MLVVSRSADDVLCAASRFPSEHPAVANALARLLGCPADPGKHLRVPPSHACTQEVFSLGLPAEGNPQNASRFIPQP